MHSKLSADTYQGVEAIQSCAQWFKNNRIENMYSAAMKRRNKVVATDYVIFKKNNCEHLIPKKYQVSQYNAYKEINHFTMMRSSIIFWKCCILK